MASILVIEDEPEIAELVRRILVREGYQVDWVPHGLAALQMLQGRSYDLIISNVWMPVMDGPTFYAHLLEHRPELARRVLFCTGDMISPYVRSFLQSCQRPVLAKPFGIAHLCEMVRCCLKMQPCQAPLPWLSDEFWAAAAI